jgi:hypothetical protein
MIITINDGYCTWRYQMAGTRELSIYSITEAISEAFPNSPLDDGTLLENGNHTFYKEAADYFNMMVNTGD